MKENPGSDARETSAAPAAGRETATCPYRKKCGGCEFIGRDYGGYLAEKEAYVRKLLKPYVNLSGMTGMEDPLHYRNKAHRVVSFERSGKRDRHVSGIYAEGTHKVVPVKECLIEDEAADRLISDILELAASFRIKAFNEDTGVGLLRHVLVRTARATGEIMAVLVLTSPVMPGKKNFVRELRRIHPELTTLVINVNNRPTSMVLGDREEAVFGRGFITDELCGRKFRISPGSFYQVNPVQTEKLYTEAVRCAGLTGKETVIDAYCGIGTIGIAASGFAKKVIGIELNREAVRDAVVNAKLNDVSNCTFCTGDAGEFLTEMAAEKKKADVIFMDPPRSGSTEAFISAAASVGPERIVYVSCCPETLARDLGRFAALGYRTVKAGSFDMFPFTQLQHVETVAVLKKKLPQS